MPRPDADPDEHDAPFTEDRTDAVSRDDTVRNGNPGVPQSRYAVDDESAPTDPADPPADRA